MLAAVAATDPGQRKGAGTCHRQALSEGECLGDGYAAVDARVDEGAEGRLATSAFSAFFGKFIRDSRDVNLAMFGVGPAWWYRKYANE
jgi:hypothetical protein